MQSAFKSPTSIHIQLIEWDLFLFTICVCNSSNGVNQCKEAKIKNYHKQNNIRSFFKLKLRYQSILKCCWPKKWVATIRNCFESITNYSFISRTYLTHTVFVYLITSEKKTAQKCPNEVITSQTCRWQERESELIHYFIKCEAVEFKLVSFASFPMRFLYQQQINVKRQTSSKLFHSSSGFLNAIEFHR